MTAYLRTEELPLAEVQPYPGNARLGDVPKIRASLRRNAQYKALTVRKHGPASAPRYTVLVGNNTRLAMLAEGWTTARCEIIRCSSAEARRINATDNRLQDLATYDPDARRDQIAALQGDYEGTGYTAEQAAGLLAWSPPSADPLTSGGDPGDPGGSNGRSWGVVVTCDGEDEQAQLLARFAAEGLTVRALTGG